MKTIDVVIEQCEEIANASKQHTLHMTHFSQSYDEWAEEWTQIAEWLKELKAYKEQGGDAISRKYILDLIATKGANLDDDLLIVEQWIQDAPSVNPHPIECGDAISMEAAVNAIYDLCGENVSLKENPLRDNPHMDAVVDALENLPSVTPQQRTGRWIQKEEEGDAEPFIIWECSECHCVDEDGKPSYKYCPQCGAKMEVEE